MNVGERRSPEPFGSNFSKTADDVNKELLRKALEGMEGLYYLRQESEIQNHDPNLQHRAIESLHAIMGHKSKSKETDGIDYETKSITSAKYN